jgi:glycerol-3-phosphate dehydrogenase
MSPDPAGRPFDRDRAWEQLGAETFDVLVVGGGVTGAGVALDAASRGLRTALVERADFAHGTSSKSSKMIHGGIRYLQQKEVRLVYENLAERQRLLDNAPHLVSPLPFLIPLFGRDGAVAKGLTWSYSSALWGYDLTGGIRIGARHRRLSKEEALGHLPGLRADRLVAGFLYFDARADDARLTLTLVRSAVEDHGAVAANYAEVAAFLTDGRGRVHGARIRPTGPGPRAEVEVRAAVAVNATGVWADEVGRLAGGGAGPGLRPAKGIHVTVPRDRFPADIAAVIPVRQDRRSIFVVPWPETDLVYLGTTDTAYEGPLDDPPCTPEDVAYVLGAANGVSSAGLTPADVTGVWAGLRPLLAPPPGRRLSARTADLSRRHTVSVSPAGMVSVTGGKLTTYRKMAEQTVDAAVAQLGGPAARRRSVTARLPLHGAPGARPGRDRLADAELAGPLRAHLVGRYGTEVPDVLALADGRPELLQPVVEGLPYLGVEVVWAARREMAQSVDDVLSRRTRARLQRAEASSKAAPAVARLLADELGWDAAQADASAAAYSAAVDHELAVAAVGPAAAVLVEGGPG